MIYKTKQPGSLVVTLEDIRKENPNTSFPDSVTVDTLKEFGYFQVVTTLPEYNPNSQKVASSNLVFENGNWVTQHVIEPITPEELSARYEFIKNNLIMHIQKRLDDFAQSRGYDSLLSACSYATSKVPKFQTEGQYCVDLRDQTWITALRVMQEVKEGVRPLPTQEELFSLLPELKWPS